MGTILKFPPKIIHQGGSPDLEGQGLIVDQALSNLRVPSAGRRLMKYYASQAQGFRPSLKVISEATEINPYNISRCRALLVDYGLIDYDGDNVLIHWLRLRAFASMEPEQMGRKKDWNIAPVASESVSQTKNDLHNYIGTMSSADKRLYAIYEATAEAIADGVEFPELRSDYIVDQTKNDLHNYIGDVDFNNGPGVMESGSGWYNPFDEPDPPWVYQIPICDAYGQIVAFAHYDTRLPF